MGLDMTFVKKDKYGNVTEIAYFRKHADLHGILQDTFLEKNENMHAEDFNCIDYEITMNEVTRIVNYMNSVNKQHYSGFFWGRSTEEDWEQTINLLVEVVRIIANGEQVFYQPWW